MKIIRRAKFLSSASVDGLTYGKEYEIVEAYGGEYIGVIDDSGKKIIATDFWFG